MIRRAELEDIPRIEALLGQVLLVHHMGRPDIFKEKGQKYTREELKDLILDRENPIFVYTDDTGLVVGHCFCQSIEKPESSNSFARKTLFIDDLCIDESMRGKHVGKEMYDYVKCFAIENKYNNIALHAWECNPKAVGFYEHLGMQIQQYTMEEIL